MPLERGTLVRAVACFALLTSALLPVACFVGTVCGAATSGDLDCLPLGRFWLAGLNAWGVAGFWTGAALVISVLAPTRGASSLAFAGAVTVGLTLDTTARLSPQVEYLARFTPFGYLRPADVAAGASHWLPHTLGLTAAGAALVLLASALESRRRRA